MLGVILEIGGRATGGMGVEGQGTRNAQSRTWKLPEAREPDTWKLVCPVRRGEVGKGLAKIPPEGASGRSRQQTVPRRPLTLLFAGHGSLLPPAFCLFPHRTAVAEGDA